MACERCSHSAPGSTVWNPPATAALTRDAYPTAWATAPKHPAGIMLPGDDPQPNPGTVSALGPFLRKSPLSEHGSPPTDYPTHPPDHPAHSPQITRLTPPDHLANSPRSPYEPPDHPVHPQITR